MAVPPRVLSGSSVLTQRIRFLSLVVFSVLSCTFSKRCRKKSVDQRPPKSKAEFLTPIVDFLCVKVLRRVMKDRTLVKKFRSSLKGQLNTDAVGEETKNRALEPASFRKEIIVNQSQRKAKECRLIPKWNIVHSRERSS